MEFYALDLETTGLDPRRDEILEIAWVRFLDGRPRERFQSLVRVDFVPREVQELTGISAERLRRAPPLRDVLPGVLERLSGEVVVAHNAPFDRGFLERAAERLGIGLPEIHWVDTLALARLIWPERESHALSALKEKIHIAPGESHRALPDAEATGYLFLEELAAIRYLPEASRRLLSRWVPPRAWELIGEAEAWISPGTQGARAVVEEAFSLLSKKLPGFSLRPQQVAYASWVERALERGGVYLLEAGPGTGKTYGYLVPIFIRPGRRTVISTRTKALQDQLWRRDIPTLREALKADIGVALLKGRENYICLWQLERERGLFSGGLWGEVRDLVYGEGVLEVGDLYGILGTSPEARDLLERVRDRPHRCLGRECPFLKECPSLKARLLAREADLVVVNHPLLVADYASGGRVLGEFEVLVADEAHDLPAAFREGLTETFSPSRLASLLDELGALLPPKLLPRERVRAAWAELRRFSERARGVIPAEPAPYGEEEGLRLLSLAQELIWALVELEEEVSERALSLKGTERAQVEGWISELEGLVSTMEEVLSGKGEGVFWSEGGNRLLFHHTPLGFSRELPPGLWGKLHAAVLTSATLSVRGTVDYLVRELGIPEPTYRAFPGRLEPEGAAAFILPYFPDPDSPAYPRELASLIDGLRRFGRKVLVLFTSQRMLREVGERLSGEGIISQVDFGDASQAVRAFRELRGPAVLLGLDSLWEGVDFPGEELELLVVARLPFPNPSDPVVRAEERALREEGIDPFFGLYLPRAVIKLAQGAGRLIRTPADRGAIIITDPRISTRPYGEAFRTKIPLPIREMGSPDELFFALERIFS